MDVLRYSAVQAETVIKAEINARTTCVTSRSTVLSNCTTCQSIVSGQTATRQAALAAFDTCWVQCREPCLLRRPWETTQWASIQSLTGASLGFKVCDTETQFNCGKCCQWTVPAGVTRARFQLWGAGGGSGVGCCCGGSPYGSTGAYASVIIPVTASTQYTLCAGCAYCCFPSVGGQGRLPGCQSYVTGTGLSGFCANGGVGRLGNMMAEQGVRNSNRLQVWNCIDSGACFCDHGSSYCFSNSCATCGNIQFLPGATYRGEASGSTSVVYGIRGIWPGICWDTNHYGNQCHAPIYGFENTSRCCNCATSGNCCGCVCRAACGILQIPAAGGIMSWNMGGGTGTCGDMGRMGMVCVTYC